MSRINVIIKLRLPDRARVTLHKEVYGNRAGILEIVQVGLSGNQDYANIVGSMAEHLEVLQSLNDRPWESSILIDIRLDTGYVGVKYRINQRATWRFSALSVEEFVDMDPGGLMRHIHTMSTTWNPIEARLATRNDPPPSRA